MVARTDAHGNGQETVNQATQNAADFNQTMLQLMIKQAAHNAQVVIALAMANDWPDALRIQSDYVRVSIGRKVYLCWRGIELMQGALMPNGLVPGVRVRKAT